MTYAPWTVTSLSNHVRGLLNRDPEATGGTVPNRISELVLQAAVEMWNRWDWKFRRKTGTLYLLDGQQETILPADFDKLDTRWLRDQKESNGRLRFTENPDELQAMLDYYGFDQSDTREEGEPKLALITRDDNKSGYFPKAVCAPRADQDYEYSYWYLTNDPWSRRASLATSFAAADSNLRILAVAPGYSAVTVTFTAGGSLTVAASDSDITVTFISGTTTAAQVKAAWDAAATVVALAYCDLQAGNDGTGVVSALAKTTLGWVLSDTGIAPWPSTFNTGWQLMATAFCRKQFGDKDDFDNDWRAVKYWFDQQLGNNDETIATPNEFIRDGYNDTYAHMGNAGSPWRMGGNIGIRD
jgi:hypothetical protein